MKGIIYKIVCNETGEVYYGSTTQSLNKRMSHHKNDYKRWKAGTFSYLTSFNIIDRGNYSYSLIETVECEDKKQLEARERFYIENNECINHVIPRRTKKEWYDVNKENREANREQIKKQMKEYYDANKEKLKEQTKLYRQANKEHLNELRRQRRQRQRELGLPVY